MHTLYHCVINYSYMYHSCSVAPKDKTILIKNNNNKHKVHKQLLYFHQIPTIELVLLFNYYSPDSTVYTPTHFSLFGSYMSYLCYFLYSLQFIKLFCSFSLLFLIGNNKQKTMNIKKFNTL